MDRLHKYITYPFKYEFNINIFPKYIIKKYIKTYPHNNYELGYIYQYYYKNYNRMHEYYKQAINSGNSYAMLCLGAYYNDIKNYDLMYIFYNMACKLNNSYAFHNLAFYYMYNVKNHDLAIQYFKRASELNNTNAMLELGRYYYNNNDYYLYDGIDYYEAANELGNYDAMYKLGKHHEDNFYYDSMKEYYIIAIKLNNNDCISSLQFYYKALYKDWP